MAAAVFASHSVTPSAVGPAPCPDPACSCSPAEAFADQIRHAVVAVGQAVAEAALVVDQLASCAASVSCPVLLLAAEIQHLHWSALEPWGPADTAAAVALVVHMLQAEPIVIAAAKAHQQQQQEEVVEGELLVVASAAAADAGDTAAGAATVVLALLVLGLQLAWGLSGAVAAELLLAAPAAVPKRVVQTPAAVAEPTVAAVACAAAAETGS